MVPEPTATTDYADDSLNRPTCVGPNQIVGSCPLGNVGYQYDSAGGTGAPYPGQRTKITYPDAKTVNYTYEQDGNMKKVTDWLGKETTYNYDAAGRLTSTIYPNATCAAYGYDAANRLTSVVNRRPTCSPNDTIISTFTYTLDRAGNRTQIVDSS